MDWLPRTSSRVRREAAEWIARRGRGFDAGDTAAFASWYADARNARVYDRLASIWELSVRANPRSNPAFSASRQRPIGGFALAAALVAVMVVVGALLLGARSVAPDRQSLLLASAIGEVVPFRLADGTRVILDSQSKVAVDYSSGARRLTLVSGRARFEPSADRRPFEVSAGGATFEGKASAFDLSLIGGLPTAHLLKGSLSLLNAQVGGSRWSVPAGEMVRIASGARPRTAPVRASDLSWPRRMLEFDRTPLRDVVILANRYSSTHIRLADPGLGSLAVSGVYRAGDTSGLARSLSVAFGLDLQTTSGSEFVLSRKAR